LVTYKSKSLSEKWHTDEWVSIREAHIGKHLIDDMDMKLRVCIPIYTSQIIHPETEHNVAMKKDSSLCIVLCEWTQNNMFMCYIDNKDQDAELAIMHIFISNDDDLEHIKRHYNEFIEDLLDTYLYSLSIKAWEMIDDGYADFVHKWYEELFYIVR